MYLYTISGGGISSSFTGHASSYEDARMVARLMAKQLVSIVLITFPNGKEFDEGDLPAGSPYDESFDWENEYAEDVAETVGEDDWKKSSGYFMCPPLFEGREIKKG